MMWLYNQWWTAAWCNFFLFSVLLLLLLYAMSLPRKPQLHVWRRRRRLCRLRWSRASYFQIAGVVFLTKKNVVLAPEARRLPNQISICRTWRSQYVGSPCVCLHSVRVRVQMKTSSKKNTSRTLLVFGLAFCACLMIRCVRWNCKNNIYIVLTLSNLLPERNWPGLSNYMMMMACGSMNEVDVWKQSRIIA